MARLREIVAGFLAISLVTAPMMGATVEILGTIVTAEGARVSGADVAPGTTVFSGDQLATSDRGSLLVRTAAARLQLDKASVATIDRTQGTPTATLLRGAAAFSTANAKAFALNISNAVIRPKSDAPTIGEVAVLGQKQLVVKCTRGALTITVGDDSREIPEGSAYRVVLDPALSGDSQDQPPPQGAGTKGNHRMPRLAGRSRFVWYATAGVAILTLIVVHEALESDDKP